MFCPASSPLIGRPHAHNPLGVEMGSVLPIIVPLEEILNGTTYGEVTSGVYVTVDEARVVRYVGSVDRCSPALKSRLSAHLRRRAEARQTWTGLGLVRCRMACLIGRSCFAKAGWAACSTRSITTGSRSSAAGRGPPVPKQRKATRVTLILLAPTR